MGSSRASQFIILVWGWIFNHAQIIFVSALRAIKQFYISFIGMDVDFTKKFGGVSAIPQLFLIDPNGKIIYNRNFRETDYEKLTRLNQILKGKLTGAQASDVDLL